MTTSAGVRRPARERLLEAANELFYAEGVQTVGIDRIIEHAGVAKATTLQHVRQQGRAGQGLSGEPSRGNDGAAACRRGTRNRSAGAVARVFDGQAGFFSQPGFRGCAFSAATAEAPPGGLIERAADDYRADIRGLFADLAAEAGVDDPDALARQLQLLYDGAGMSAPHGPGPLDRSRGPHRGRESDRRGTPIAGRRR